MKRMNSSTWRAVQRVKDRLREGGVLMQMHTTANVGSFFPPGKAKGVRWQVKSPRSSFANLTFVQAETVCGPA